ncbi:MAG: ATP-binding protein [Deltaproteobacteria bacterium]|nr:ATP-binding protein [Deltaproteobacteria bacterium]
MKNFNLHFETQSDFGYLPFLTRIFKSLNVPHPQALTQILIEAYTNAVIHAHRRKKEKWIGLSFFISPKKILIRVVDQGPGIKNKLLRKKFSRWQTHGRGLMLIRANADKVTNKKRGRLHIFEAVRFYA